MNIQKFNASSVKDHVKSHFETAEGLRADTNNPTDASLAAVYGKSVHPKSEDAEKAKETGMSHLMAELGIDPYTDTISNLLTVQHDAPKFIIREVLRDAVSLGLRAAPVYPNIIASEEPITSLTIQMPHLNMMDAAPRYVNEGETIQLGDFSYGTKSLKVRKMGRGIGMTDEFKRYTTLNIVQMFLRDFGVKLGYALDGMAINILLNGEQADGSTSAPVMGVTTPGTVVYRDLSRIWVRLARLGRKAQTMISGEAMAIDIMDIEAFQKRESGTTKANLNVKTPIPTDASLFIHGAIPDDQVVILDPATTMLKYNATPLLVESERIVSNQTQNMYASISTGFGIMFRDSRIVVDSSINVNTTPFPAYMNVDLLEASELK